MSTKATGVPCYDKAATSEPLFVLRAQDMTAPILVAAWILFQFVVDLITQQNVCPEAKLREALECALAMRSYDPKKRKLSD